MRVPSSYAGKRRPVEWQSHSAPKRSVIRPKRRFPIREYRTCNGPSTRSRSIELPKTNPEMRPNLISLIEVNFAAHKNTARGSAAFCVYTGRLLLSILFSIIQGRALMIVLSGARHNAIHCVRQKTNASINGRYLSDPSRPLISIRVGRRRRSTFSAR